MTENSLHAYLDRPYSTRVAPDCGTFGELRYFASVEELPGCESDGATPDEAMTNLRDAMELYIGLMLEDGIEPPEPRGLGRVVWTIASATPRPAPLTVAP